MEKYIYLFDEGNSSMNSFLGSKGANLAQMTNLGLPVPKGFILTTELCKRYYSEGKSVIEEIKDEIDRTIRILEVNTGKEFGKAKNPLLLSVRSGASVSMPGMMDSILNIGLNDEIVNSLILTTENKKFAYDSYRRLIQMYGEVVNGIEAIKFEDILNSKKNKNSTCDAWNLEDDDFIEVILKFKELVKTETGTEFPQDPSTQLLNSIIAVFKSWQNSRAVNYRNLNKISNDLYTAVTIQEMVYGNMGDTSGTGIIFSRNPFTGEKNIYGEFLMNAQGEDIVSGIRTPREIKDINPLIFNQLVEYADILEKFFKDVQDIEFTIENGKLFLLQTRNAKRTISASIKILVDFVRENLLTKEEVIGKVNKEQLGTLLYPKFAPKAIMKSKVIARSETDFKGAVVGRIYFKINDVLETLKNEHNDVILILGGCSKSELDGIKDTNGLIFPNNANQCSFEAIYGHVPTKCLISNIIDSEVNKEKGYFIDIEGVKHNKGDWISIDGATGNVYGEKLPLITPELNEDLQTLIKWMNELQMVFKTVQE
ncbi:PEP/pyruvate-binding domain-containing protein [Ruminiclostridium josui]|uniref:PEP/pyruvate-binding domain-containing protein n=1 Tax=Ruminiclostridium josui TaxID=1499 RepID=UPI0004667C3A|nr:PEP/pyruvate-binding domain-containing protein [Ruminiclostridium josui]